MSGKPHVLILGGGPAGLGAAYRLRTLQRADVTLLERGERVGGNAGSFELNGQFVDYGSHRLHPSCDPVILEDIRRLLGGDLLDRPRHGRIRLRGRWVHFPLKPFDMLRRVDNAFLAGAARDAAVRLVRRAPQNASSFADALHARLGPTICESFYFPYARKIWGRDPDQLSATQAQRRVAANSPGKLIRRVLSQVPGMRAPGAGRFFYPRRGFGQISSAYADAAQQAGADLLLGWTVTGVSKPGTADAPWTVTAERNGESRSVEGDYLWSTVPVTLLARMTRPAPPEAAMRAAAALEFRAMLLIYLELPTPKFTEFDAHYFPGADVRITRLTEPKNYSDRGEPAGTTTLCAELPCSTEDEVWNASDDELGALVCRDIETAGLPAVQPRSVHVHRIRFAYPIYTQGYEQPFNDLDEWAAGMPRLLSFGRQGLFAHDNTHHALAMAYAAVDCLSADGFDAGKWQDYRREFEKHVVVD